MPLNKQKGNMYDFVTHTWNTVKGKCYHDCTYCYMKRHGELKDIRFDEKELKTDHGTGNVIFVGSSNDMFAEQVPDEWINKTLEHCRKYKNTYLFQSKDPFRMLFHTFPKKSIFGTTIETNSCYNVSKAPPVLRRAGGLFALSAFSDYETMITIEPILDFDTIELVNLIQTANPKWVNIGADSKKYNLPEPSFEKVKELISELQEFTTVRQKKNLDRLKR